MAEIKTVSKSEVVKNRIYFYNDVERSTALDFNKSIRNMKNGLIRRQVVEEMDDPGNIFVHINTFGGSVFAGIAMMDEILNVKEIVPVTTVIDGCCMSAGTFMSVVGTRRLINPHAFILVHQMSHGFWGKYEELVDWGKNSRKLMKMIKNIYCKHTKMSKSFISELLKRDLYLDAKECIKYGLVDGIVGRE